MRILVSYFYHVRHFKPYMIPFSTAVWDPAWYHNFNKCHNYTYLDKNGVLNGLRMPLLKPGQKCKGLCSGKELCLTLFGKLIPDECLFLKEYKAQLERLDFESVKATLEGQARFVKECLGFEEEPIIVLLVHEAPNNPCSERWALKDWFLDNGYILEEYDPKNFEEDNMETIDHFVEFDKYCKTCKFRDKNDKKGEEPCNECLDNPINQDSRKPVNYKEDTDEIERLEKEEKKKLEENK